MEAARLGLHSTRRRYSLALALILGLALPTLGYPVRHVLAPLVPLYVSGIINSFLMLGDWRKLSNTPDKDRQMAVVGLLLVLPCFSFNFWCESEEYLARLLVESVATSIAIYVFKRLKLDRSPVGRWRGRKMVT